MTARLEPPQLNEAYKIYLSNQSPENYEIFGESLHTFVWAVLRKRFINITEDNIQDGLVKVLEGLSSFDASKADFAVWVQGVVCNNKIDALRKRKGIEEVELDPHESYEENYVEHLALKKIRETLSPEENKLIELKLEGLSNEDVAAELDTTEGYVKQMWNRIVRKLRTLGGGS